MSEMSRRDFGTAMAMLSAVSIGAEAQVPGPGTFGAARVIVPSLTKLPNGSERWTGPDGSLATGEDVKMHLSVVPAGTPGAALHVIKHTEFIIVIEGTIEFAHGEVIERAEAGSVIYVAYGTNHAIRNVGTETARYLVLQIGGDTKKA